MRANGDIEVLANDIDRLVRRMSNDIDLWKTEEEISDHLRHRELRRGDGRGKAHGTHWFRQALAHGGLGLFGLLQHRGSVPIELAARFCHPEVSRRPIEKPDAEIRLQLLYAMAQRRFWNPQLATCGAETTTVDDLHEIEEVVQVEHADSLRPTCRTLSSIFATFETAVHGLDGVPSLPNGPRLATADRRRMPYARFSPRVPSPHVRERSARPHRPSGRPDDRSARLLDGRAEAQRRLPRQSSKSTESAHHRHDHCTRQHVGADVSGA